MRAAIGVELLAWAGFTLLIDRLRWFRRPALADRVRPYLAGAAIERPSTALTVASFREVLAPLATAIGSGLARLFGVHEDAGRRLARIGASMTVSEHRTKQVGRAMVAFAIASIATAALALPPVVGALCILGTPLLVFLVAEQRLATASEHWKNRVVLELPVLTEQLGMLLGAGFSLGAALARLAERTHGAVHHDVARVCMRVRQGLGELDALREWAERADVVEVTRLVAVLGLNHEGGDLGRLIADEARSTRLAVHRQRIELIERRSQQVWVPVTVATLVPGVIFLAVPFLEALRLFSDP